MAKPQRWPGCWMACGHTRQRHRRRHASCAGVLQRTPFSGADRFLCRCIVPPAQQNRPVLSGQRPWHVAFPGPTTGPEAGGGAGAVGGGGSAGPSARKAEAARRRPVADGRYCGVLTQGQERTHSTTDRIEVGASFCACCPSTERVGESHQPSK